MSWHFNINVRKQYIIRGIICQPKFREKVLAVSRLPNEPEASQGIYVVNYKIKKMDQLRTPYGFCVGKLIEFLILYFLNLF